MSEYIIQASTLTDIADAIREKNGTTNIYTPSEMAECIRQINSGITLNAFVASELPSVAENGQIVVITEVAANAIYIDTDEPTNIAIGDIWIKVDADSNVILELTEESPYFRNGLTLAQQYTGSAWQVYDGYLGIGGEWIKFSEELPAIGTTLNDMTWEQISKISRSGKAPEYFSIGDTKEILIDGALGTETFENVKLDAFIIGFNHNAALEGENTIHFQIGKQGSTHMALTDGAETSSNSNAFVMYTSDISKGGWENSNMRKNLLGNNYTPDAPREKSYMEILGPELRAVLRAVPKYTDNIGDASDVVSNISSTLDYLWLLSPYEVHGNAYTIANLGVNTAELDYQQQYEYYAAGNYSAPSSLTDYGYIRTSAPIWSRSPSHNYSGSFMGLRPTSSPYVYSANKCMAIMPAFCV